MMIERRRKTMKVKQANESVDPLYPPLERISNDELKS